MPTNVHTHVLDSVCSRKRASSNFVPSITNVIDILMSYESPSKKSKLEAVAGFQPCLEK